jgi:hypothetical protein
MPDELSDELSDELPAELPANEEWLCWREFKPVASGIEGKPDEPPRLLIPHSNPYVHEFPIDFLFKTEAEADEALEIYDVRDEAVEEGWVLVKMTLTPVRRAS